MNSTTKKFIKLINKEHDNLFKVLKKEYDALYSKRQAGIYFETRNKIDSNIIATPEELELEADKQVDKVYVEFKRSRKEDLDRLDDLDFLATCYDKDGFFDRYDLLKIYLEKFEFNKREQAEVYAFYFNTTIKHILNFLVNHKNRILDNVTEAVDNSKVIGKKLFRKKIIKDCYERDLAKTKQEQSYVSNLRNIISESGNVLPSDNANDFLWVFDKINLEIPKAVILAILTESTKRHIEQKKEKEAKRQAIIKNEQAKEESNKKMLEKASEREQANKERRVAVQELKKYLNNDFPIRYLNDNELLIVIKLLETANYDQSQILNIKKLIIENNYQITINELNKRLNAATERYLSAEEMEILSSACTILNDPDAIKNSAYNTITETYNVINGMLIEFIGNDDDNNPAYNEDAELLILYIKELGDNIINYNFSDYRYTRKLELEKKDN